MTAIDVQGTKTYITDVPATAWADCTEAITAIQAGDEALCPQSLGDLARSRAVTEYSCISSNDSMKSTGKMTYGDFAIELLFDPADAAGQLALFTAMENNTPIILAMESPNADITLGEVGASGDIVWTEAKVSGDTISYPVDGLVGYNVTLAPYGGFLRCATQAGAAA